MTTKPTDAAVAAWTGLNRAHDAARGLVERRLKDAGHPPLAWYDVLWELERSEHGALRPVDLERRMLVEQYNISRLIDRLVKAGLVERCICPEDGRGKVVAITEAGRAARAAVWPDYAAAIGEAVGERLARDEAGVLAVLLERIARR